jgi:FXSXX-COOH protein
MNTGDDTDRQETFSSDVIDLSDVDLSLLSELPGSVLRAAIQRVCEELAGDGETSAYFQSSLRGAPPGGEACPRGSFTLTFDGENTRMPGLGLPGRIQYSQTITVGTEMTSVCASALTRYSEYGIGGFSVRIADRRLTKGGPR